MSNISTNAGGEPSLDDIKKQIDEWRQTPQAAGAAGAFDWTLLLTVIPMLLKIFVKDDTLRGIIDQIIQVITSLFKT